MRRARGIVVGVGVALVLGACATTGERVQRALEGPGADEVWTARFARSYGRGPTFEERSAWRDELDQRVGAYLRAHPDVGTSPRSSQFRFQRRVQVGMTRDEVLLLLDAPETVTADEAAMRAAAGGFWPSVGPRAKEMWLYPAAWQLYFADGRLVDITVRGRAALE